MKIAVIAASGLLGTEIVKAIQSLVGRESIVAIARDTSKASHLDVKIRKGDYNLKEDFDEALHGVGALLLVSGMDHPTKRIAQHRKVIDAARDAGVRRIVYTSVQGPETGTAFSPVVNSNRQTEQDICSRVRTEASKLGRVFRTLEHLEWAEVGNGE